MYCGPVLRHAAEPTQAANCRSSTASYQADVGRLALGLECDSHVGHEPGFVVAPGELDERGSQPLTTLLARTIQAKDDAGWVARVVWGGVGWGFQR